MTLPLPMLDNRIFSQLVAEGTAQIPRLTPGWTDYNASDPGITLLELLAWLSEQNLYRTDRVPDEMVRAFLRLVDIAPAPACVAECVVLLDTAAGPVTLPDRVKISDTAGAVTFETTDPVTVSAAHLVSMLTGGDVLTVVDAGSFLPFGAAPRPGDALYLGFDAPLGPVGAAVSLHVWTTTPTADAASLAALIAEWRSRRAAAERDCPADIADQPDDWRRHYAVRTAWEFHAADGAWQTLPGVEDETRALTLTGFVRFAAPAGHVAGGPGPNFYIRCRILSGAFDCPTPLDLVGLNAVPAEHAAGIPAPEKLGAGDGHAADLYATAATPVVAGSTRLTLTNGAQQDTTWTEVTQWDLVGPHDHAYLLDPVLGRITTGNGMRGAVLPAGWQVSVDYRVGGGVAGNVAAGTLSKIAGTLSVTQPVAAFGGAAAETLAAAEARAVASLSAPARTVTLGDVVALACAVPGVPVARAAAFANMHPAVPCFTAPGSLTVVVVPNCPGPAPTPGAAFLRAVAAYLDRRRPVTTELHVVAPTYVTVTVTATLQADGAADAARLPLLAQQALDRWFSPLTGGPGGAGWPIGRGVYRTEVMALLAALPGVLTVTGLGLAADFGPPACGNVDLCATDLVQSGQHAITTIVNGTATFSRSKQRECD